jgi:hypothetical protein
MDLDGFCRKLAKEVPPFLMEGGFFQITLQWAHLRGEDWHQRLEEWFQGSGCDALVLRLETKDPILHAEETVCDTGRASPKEREENFNKIVRYFGEKGVEAVSGGFIVMRRRSGGANWVRFEDLQNRELVPFGDAITAAFEAKDFLAGLRKREDLLSIKPRVAPNVAIESKHCSNDTGWEEGEYFLHQQKGFRLRARVDVHTVNLVRRCDGRRTLRDILAETARSLHLDPRKVTAGTVELANHLIERGFLLRSQ